MKCLCLSPYTSSERFNQYTSDYDARLFRGAYHASSGAEQASYFVEHRGNWSNDGQTLPGTVDLESMLYDFGVEQ
jgi:hypothetical protein